MNTLARRLKASRIEAGFDSTRALAPSIGRSWSQVRNYEAGTAVPPADVLLAWANATGKPIEYFFPAAAPVETPPARKHPGLDLLARDKALRARYHIEDAEIERARTLVTPYPIGDAETAVEAIHLLRRLTPPG